MAARLATARLAAHASKRLRPIACWRTRARAPAHPCASAYVSNYFFRIAPRVNQTAPPRAPARGRAGCEGRAAERLQPLAPPGCHAPRPPPTAGASGASKPNLRRRLQTCGGGANSRRLLRKPAAAGASLAPPVRLRPLPSPAQIAALDLRPAPQ
eukprot:CAMPEP_0172180624 /NCGR_PEP_ID=MMETSP1050-20130122/17347_1 /TAXON_ID=233186 /ORGANISM="Cryptomonas curvata, Strain CCAP979/52" /LENGTH=154 /DNA_ID=CAMNT_0012853779 /DNA_START=74 /DNA_END=535 /DNA_ORIENTATION=-